MRTPADLSALLSRRFPLRHFTLTVAGRVLELCSAKSIDELIDRISEDQFSVDERMPYWADVWHSAVALAEHMSESPDIVAGKDILDIGCGLGVPGIMAALLGARVTFGDYDDDALLAAEMNLATNAPRFEASFTCIDIRHKPQRKWDVVLAADIVYEHRMIDPARAFLRHAVTEDGCFVLAEPNRSVAEDFVQSLDNIGFKVEQVERGAWLHDRLVHVSIYTGRRRHSE